MRVYTLTPYNVEVVDFYVAIPKTQDAEKRVEVSRVFNGFRP
jgi:hypothetical protein